MAFLHQFLSALTQADACWVSVSDAQGSTPREIGAWMAVFAHETIGTIGGGHVEWQATAHAREMLAAQSRDGLAAGCALPQETRRYALGPSLGQCCGGVMHLNFEGVTATDLAALKQRLTPTHPHVALFGGGHVGHALARVLAPLPLQLTWIDSRDGIFSQLPPDGVVCEHSEPVHAAVPTLAAGSEVLIMSFSHAEDLDVVAACLERQRAHGDLGSIGLIGSATKWAAFQSRLRHRGFAQQELDQITCPIGVPGIVGKEPPVIAVAVAAQLLQRLSLTRQP